MKKPNFFIVGAPKCGTTSVAAWLAEHPQVFFCPIKEPHFFNFDYAERRFRSLKHYEALFSAATERHVAVGEASVRYLYSRTAVPAILRYSTDSRFIVMIRDPVDMACSLHGQAVFNGDEMEADFSRAWDLQSVRVYGGAVPSGCKDPQLLLYGSLCQVGRQIRRLLDIVSTERVLVVNLEFLKRDPRHEYLRILRFLDLEDDDRQAFPARNTAKQLRFPRVWRSIRSTNRALRAAGVPHVRTGLTEFLHRHNRIERARAPMSEALRNRLREYFAADVALLEELTNLDLADWKPLKQHDR